MSPPDEPTVEPTSEEAVEPPTPDEVWREKIIATFRDYESEFGTAERAAADMRIVENTMRGLAIDPRATQGLFVGLITTHQKRMDKEVAAAFKVAKRGYGWFGKGKGVSAHKARRVLVDSGILDAVGNVVTRKRHVEAPLDLRLLRPAGLESFVAGLAILESADPKRAKKATVSDALRAAAEQQS
jgi:hypothetical protein